nr:DegT/DnrJ/EryC1/StrS family aminotransferase [Pseudoalteromonas piscicida]
MSQLETDFAKYFGVKHATALNSGTAALHAALFSLDIAPGDEVIVPNLTFIAPAMAAIHNRCRPRFADVDKRTYNITADSIEKEITPRTKAVIVVHMHGTPVDLDPVLELQKKYNFKLIEDVAQAPGARYKGRLVGSFGDAAIFSLMSQKNLATCGECGVLLNHSLEAKNKAEMLRIYGEVLDNTGDRKYNSYTLGWNYTLNPIQASMAINQLTKFDSLTKELQRAGENWIKKLTQFHWIETPLYDSDFEGVFHFFRIRIRSDHFNQPNNGRLRLAIQNALAAEGLNTRLYQNCPLSMQPFFLNMNNSTNQIEQQLESFPNTIDILRNTLILGANGSSPAYLLSPGTIDAYVKGLVKIENHIDEIIDYSNSLHYEEPWEETPKITDSFGVTYTDNSPSLQYEAAT